MNEVAAQETRYFERMTLSQRIQHLVVIVSFILLITTGFPLRFSSSDWAQAYVRAMGGYEARAIVHRIGAIMLIAAALYHFIEMAVLGWRNRDNIRRNGITSVAMVWNFKDWVDIKQSIQYYTRTEAQAPRYGRFSYVEKIEYWSMIWGTIVMILSGAVLWEPFKALTILPRWIVNVSLIVHSYEATLAILALIVWHFYTVHFSPDHFPMSPVWITGKMSAEEMQEHHPLEYERLTSEEAGSESRPPAV